MSKSIQPHRYQFMSFQRGNKIIKSEYYKESGKNKQVINREYAQGPFTKKCPQIGANVMTFRI